MVESKNDETPRLRVSVVNATDDRKPSLTEALFRLQAIDEELSPVSDLPPEPVDL